MNIPLASFLLGCFIIALGVLGGGISIKGVEFPKVIPFIRVSLGFVGLFLVLFGFIGSGVLPQITNFATTATQSLLKSKTQSSSSEDDAKRILFTTKLYAFGQGRVSFGDNGNLVTVTTDTIKYNTGFGMTKPIELSEYNSLSIDVSYSKDSDFIWDGKLFQLKVNKNVVYADDNQTDSKDKTYVRAFGTDANGRVQNTYTFDISEITTVSRFQVVMAACNNANVQFSNFKLRQ